MSTPTLNEIKFFHREGYLPCPALLTPEHSQRVINDINRLKELRTGSYRERNSDDNGSALIVTLPHLGGLTSHPPTIAKVKALMGDSTFALHHQHAERHDENTPGSNWHHDYEQLPQLDRNQLMVHCFYYPNGLNGEVGDLLVLPKSHNSVMHKNAFSSAFYAEDLPGSKTFDNLPPGSAVIVHSALMHARRKKTGHSARYFTDISYCQAGPQKWPSYGFPLPKMWLHQKMYDGALKAGHGRGGTYDFLYDASIFYDQETANDIQREEMERVLEWRSKKGSGGRETHPPADLYDHHSI
jgi:hypothetical protein